MNAGDVVVLNFPFSDLSGSKPRPAVVIARVGPGDCIACQVTSQAGDRSAIELRSGDFVRGGLQATSYARPGKLFTAHRSVIAKWVGRLGPMATEQIKRAVIETIENG